MIDRASGFHDLAVHHFIMETDWPYNATSRVIPKYDPRCAVPELEITIRIGDQEKTIVVLSTIGIEGAKSMILAATSGAS